VDFFKAERFFEGDSARFSVGDEAEVADEEDSFVVHGFVLDALEFGCQEMRDRVSEVGCESGCAYGGAVVELDFIGLM